MSKIKTFVLVVFSLLKNIPFRVLEIIANFLPSNSVGCKLRGLLYKPFFRKCGRNFQVSQNVKFESMKNIVIGNDVYIGYSCWINGIGGGITFEDEVLLGPFVKMVSGNHAFLNGSARYASSKPKSIKIKYGTWLASSVVITSGVEIGKSCLVAAGAVVTKSQPANSVIAGVPAKVIKEQPN